jgi:Tol biopolymer transport system component
VAGVVAVPARDTNGVAGRLVFGPDNDSDLWLLVLPDGKPQRITKLGPGEFSSSPAWSADGSQIAYTYYKLPTGTRFPVPEGTDLHVVNADGTGGRLVAEHQVRGAALQNPAWSGDGSAIYVAYMARLPTGGVDAGIDQVAIASGARTRVVPGAAFPSLSRDGQRLAYVRLAAGDVRGETLWWSAADGGHPQQILGPDVFVKLSAVRLAPDGQRLVFAAIGDGATYRDPDGSAGALAPLGWIGRLLGGPIAYADGEQWDLWTIDITGRNLRRLTRLGEDLPVAAWAPDGQSIAFLGGGSAVTAQTGVAIVDADGRRDPQRVTSQPGHRGLDWAPPPGR